METSYGADSANLDAAQRFTHGWDDDPRSAGCGESRWHVGDGVESLEGPGTIQDESFLGKPGVEGDQP
jgi:hypothetical protein